MRGADLRNAEAGGNFLHCFVCLRASFFLKEAPKNLALSFAAAAAAINPRAVQGLSACVLTLEIDDSPFDVFSLKVEIY